MERRRGHTPGDPRHRCGLCWRLRPPRGVFLRADFHRLGTSRMSIGLPSAVQDHASCGIAPPADAIDLLWQRLDVSHDEASFARAGAEIVATWGEDAPSSTRDERAEIGRLAVLEIVRDACERTPELELDWFAVAPLG